MGNKSKMKNHSRIVKTRDGELKMVRGWRNLRDLTGARNPPSRTKGWAGLQEKAIAPMVRRFDLGLNVRLVLPIIYPSARLGTLRGHLNRRVA